MRHTVTNIKFFPYAIKLLQSQIDITARKLNEACFSKDNYECFSYEHDCDENQGRQGLAMDDKDGDFRLQFEDEGMKQPKQQQR